MRIGVDYRAVTAAPLSGIARQVRALESTLRRRPGTELRLYTAAPAGHPHRTIASCPAASSAADGLHRPRERLRFEWSFLPAAIDRDGLDVYVATLNMGLPIGKVRASTRLVLVLHDTFQLTLRNRHGSLLKECFYRTTDRIAIAHSVKLADAIWTSSEYTRQSLARLFPRARHRMHVLPNAVDSSSWAANEAPLPDGLPEPYWLVVGTREPRKNVAWFVRHWRDAGGPAALPALVVVGDPSDLPAELAGGTGVHFLARLSDSQLATVYRRALRLWQPSYAEGFGLPVVEAAACGTPVASALGSSLDEVTPPASPRFDGRDGAALQALMRRLAAAPARGDGESAAGLQAWARRYDMPAYAAAVDTLLEALP